jgi:hypothetical protein
MFGSKLKRPLLAVAVTAGLLAAAGPAGAEVVTNNNDPDAFTIDIGTSEALHQVGKPGHAAGAIAYNGHAGVGTNWATPELDANANAVFSGDAYDTQSRMPLPVPLGLV